MTNFMSGKYGGLFQMMMGTLGLVVFTVLFGSILSYFSLYWVLDTLVMTIRYFTH